MKKTLLFALAISIIASCTTSNEVVSNKLFQKRKYQKGWYVNSTKKIDKTKKYEEAEVAVAETVYEESQEVESTELYSQKRNESSETLVVQVKSDYITKAVELNTENETNELESNVNEEPEENVFKLFTVTKESEGEKKNERITENSEKNNSSGSGTPFIVLLILCIILPPAAVGLMKGWFTNEFWISVILTLLVWIPGVIYAFLLLFDLI